MTGNEEAKERVYRQYCLGEATEEDVEEVFGEDFDEFLRRREFKDSLQRTPTNEATDALVIPHEDGS
ncbi:hypothetical protein [Halorarum salinum]|uniref:Uncharacterized protein n=1 Tax=Halorarum salinum TaxID=2743089 RepID=A0A7D5QID5_9EURY|nr:hypothetical protein [Halobaculum salinum]QLG63322.1 hypothetical protein HUG12_16925 [Halobaculum salinum]